MAMVAFKLNKPGYAGVLPTPAADAKPGRSARRRVVISGRFQSHRRQYEVAIRNVSTTGALIECDTVFDRGVAGVLSAPGLDRLCKVVWSRGRFHGLAFDEPLHQSIVLSLHGVTREDVRAAEQAQTKSWFQHQAR